MADDGRKVSFGLIPISEHLNWGGGKEKCDSLRINKIGSHFLLTK